MSTVTAGVSNASFTATITQSNVSPLTVAPVLSVPLTFGAVTYVNTTSGSFTPINNTSTIHTFSTTNDLPNWWLLLVDQPIQLTATLSGAINAISKFPVQRFFFSGMPTPVVNWSTITIDGTTTGQNYLMTQNTAVNYTLFWGNGSLS